MLAELLVGSEKVDGSSKEWFVPQVGQHHGAPGILPNGGRLVKTHEPYSHVYQRAIYLVRDVRDVAVSLQTLRTMEGFNEGSFEDFLIRFARGDVAGYGTWQEHVASWLVAANDNSNILVVRYEELLGDTLVKLSEMARFLGVSVDEARLDEIVMNNPTGKVRDGKGKYANGRTLASTGEGDTNHNNWRARYSESELAILEPSMRVMRQAGYNVERH